jgi:hypothetical protein
MSVLGYVRTASVLPGGQRGSRRMAGCNFNKEETYPDESTKLLGSFEERDLLRAHGEVSCSWLKSHSRQTPAPR